MSERVTVTGPPSAAARPPHRAAQDPEGTGAAPVRSLMRVQAAHAALTCAIVALVGGGLPLLFAWEPVLSRIRILGVRLPWLVLSVVVPVVWVAVARRHVRLAERAERDFAAMARPE
ncbi:hypothetical protein [Actinoallomurus soli]|uniref:hypothetical protein n=1 Tax=Actinoallomurus soli TaxID=2952535 RepID=UPI0020937D09|nr:hypothetical protein [Actinoallomurus soli]MCO5967123.1 hypothetical protein [Actinoallomurus soli]